MISEANYREFGVPYDEVDIESAQTGWFNVIHMHGEDVMFELLKDYSVTALNWHIGETSPLLSDYAKTLGRKPVLGGLRRTAITEMHLDAMLIAIVDRAMSERRNFQCFSGSSMRACSRARCSSFDTWRNTFSIV